MDYVAGVGSYVKGLQYMDGYVMNKTRLNQTKFEKKTVVAHWDSLPNSATQHLHKIRVYVYGYEVVGKHSFRKAIHARWGSLPKSSLDQARAYVIISGTETLHFFCS